MDREALTAALEDLSDRPGQNWSEVDPPIATLITAARERLAQLPEKCGTCGGDGQVPCASLPGCYDQVVVHTLAVCKYPQPCPSCHGRGVLYPPALVERVGKLLPHTAELYAVLDALNSADSLAKEGEG